MCTGHKNPQDSGSSFLTVVVRSSAKYAPRCTERKWEMYLQQARTLSSKTTIQGDLYRPRVLLKLRRIHWIKLSHCGTSTDKTPCIGNSSSIHVHSQDSFLDISVLLPVEVQFFGEHCESSGLGEVKTRFREQVAGIQEVFDLLSLLNGWGDRRNDCVSISRSCPRCRITLHWMSRLLTTSNIFSQDFCTYCSSVRLTSSGAFSKSLFIWEWKEARQR